MVSVETTASGTTVLVSVSTAPTRPTRGSWLLLLPPRREEPEVRSLEKPEICAAVGGTAGVGGFMGLKLAVVARHHLLLLRQKAGDQNRTQLDTGWKTGPHKRESSIVLGEGLASASALPHLVFHFKM